MTIIELHEWYEAESGHSMGDLANENYNPRYVEWIERRLLGYRERMCKPENCKYQDNEAYDELVETMKNCWRRPGDVG